MICIQLDNKFDWLGFACGLFYPIIVACGHMGLGKIRKPMRNMLRIVLKRDFS